jgi:hypothetical protein
MPNSTALTKTVAITQSNYLPWRGYFDLIRSVDEFILLDCVQYTRRDWRNRNKIKTASGLAWLTIPVQAKGKYHQAIDETEVMDTSWAQGHIRTITLSYKRAMCFDEVAPWLIAELESAADEALLSRINERLLAAICMRLGIGVPIRRCDEIIDRATLVEMGPSERLAELCRGVGATGYLSGPAAKAYLEVNRFAKLGIDVDWMNYEGYPEYPQVWDSFEPKVSVIDLLLNTGSDASRYLDREAVQ